MRIRYKGLYKNDERPLLSFPDFFSNHVQHTDSSTSYGLYNRGIEGQSEKLAELYGALIETLVIRNVINIDDIDRIIGSFYNNVEIEK
jgi:hypothetical protein